jgi:catechol 2,3-dioxygenase-like lactoylglutathione lyase family enzyme
MIDHVLLEVADIRECKKFYKAVLKPLGMKLQADSDLFAGFGTKQSQQFWLSPAKKKNATHRVHTTTA